jgi:hypothetical protein
MTEATPALGLRRLQYAAILLVAMLTGVAASSPAPARADDQVFASIGTGELNGIYYPVGKAICQIVNQDMRTHGVRCSPETTPGSVDNIGALQSGELEFAIVQSDVQFAAYKGEGAWIGPGALGPGIVFYLATGAWSSSIWVRSRVPVRRSAAEPNRHHPDPAERRRICGKDPH